MSYQVSRAGGDERRVLAICDDALVPPAWLRADREPVPIRTTGEDARLNLRVDSLAGHDTGPLADRASDLVRVAAYAYALDQQISRGGDADPHRRHWQRDLALCLPVAEPTFWADPTVTAALSAALGFGTGDTWRFAFSPAGHRQLPLALVTSPSRTLEAPTATLLLSGGLDSLCAAVEAVARRGQRPVLVSHRSAPHHDRTQQGLADELRRRFPAWDFPHLSFWIHQRGAEARERTRRSRGFLVAALGSAVAGQLGVPQVLLADNGYVSLNPPINAQLVGALTSRGTHPAFLRLVNHLLALVFPDQVRVTNPLADRTRAESLSILADQDCLDLIPLTRSCATARLPKETPHCGVCSQCVDRRFATVAAGLERHDPVGGYQTDLFTASITGQVSRLLVRSYAGYAQWVARLDEEALFLEVPELQACLDPAAPDLATAARQVTEVLKRHADGVVRALAIQVERHSTALVRGELPPDCLLRVALHPEPGSEDVGPPEDAVGAEEAGIAAATPGCEPPPGRALDESRLERQGRYWFVAFDDARGLVPNLVGMRYLARLLKAAGQEVPALDLVSGATPGRSPVLAGDGQAWRPPGDLGEVLDPTTRRQVKTAARRLAVKLAEADSEAEREQVRAELEQLTDYLQAGTGKGGRARRVPDEQERARVAVSKAITRVRAELASSLPTLHTHLSQSLHLGNRCVYHPHPPRHWKVSP